MHFYKLFKIKEGELDTFMAWMRQLGTTRKDEALATFAYENVLREAYVLFKGNDGNHYVIGLNETSGDLKPEDPAVAINQEHYTIKKECLEPISGVGEVILDLP